MLVPLGQRSQAGDVVDALAECHARIRRFLGLAARLAGAAAGDDAREAAAQIHRYFTFAFPLHIDDTLRPALAADPAVTATLARMHADHGDHAALVDRVVALCAQIAGDGVPRAELRDAAAALAAVLEPHLALEERDVFPALRRLPQAVRDALHAAMRERRALQ